MLVNADAFDNGDLQAIAAAYGAMGVWDLSIPAVYLTGLSDKDVPEVSEAVQLVVGEDVWVLSDMPNDPTNVWLELTRPELADQVAALMSRVRRETTDQ
jgi:hypothetical protein